MMSPVKIHCPHAKALPFLGAIQVQASAFLLWCVTVSLKGETIARQRARPPYTVRYPCMVFLHGLERGPWDPAPAQPMRPAHWGTFVLCPCLGTAWPTEISLQLAKQLTQWLLSHLPSTAQLGRRQKEQGWILCSQSLPHYPPLLWCPSDSQLCVNGTQTTSRGSKPLASLCWCPLIHFEGRNQQRTEQSSWSTALKEIGTEQAMLELGRQKIASHVSRPCAKCVNHPTTFLLNSSWNFL